MALDERLIGAWKSDPTDREGIKRYGRATLIFTEDGDHIYIIKEAGKRQAIVLKYSTEGETLITDQPSRPQIQRTQFIIDLVDGMEKLILRCDGVSSSYVRATDEEMDEEMSVWGDD